jgi:hypothetical protein
MKEIIHVLAVYINKHEEYSYWQHNSRYDVISRRIDDDFFGILHKFNTVVIIGKIKDSSPELTDIIESSNKLGVMVILPQDYRHDINELDRVLVRLIENNEYVEYKRSFFAKKRIVVLGSEEYNTKMVRPEFVEKSQNKVSFCTYEDWDEDIVNNSDLFVLINDRYAMYKEAKEMLEKAGLNEHMHFTSLENYCHLTDRADDVFMTWAESEKHGMCSPKIVPVIYKDRTDIMSQWILPDVKSIAEFGCGECWLKDMLRPGVKYIGIDYVKRNEECIVCDISKDELPKLNVDAVFLAAVIDYIANWDRFFDYIKTLKLKQLLISNRPLELRVGWGYRYGELRSLKSFLSTGEMICKIQSRTGLMLTQSKILHTAPSQVMFDFRAQE